MTAGRRDGAGAPGGPRAWIWGWARVGGRSGNGTVLRASGRDRDRDRLPWPDVSITSARPLLRPTPRSAMFFPLAVLVAVLPGLSALNNWDLTPPGPWWGLRGLAVLEGHVLDQAPAAAEVAPVLEAQAFRSVASQPPLYAWLEAVGLALSPDRDPLATVLPSYAAGALVVVLVYLHGRLWCGAGVGLVAAVLTGFNPNLLVQMQQATPTTLALAGVLGALWCYGAYLRRTSTAGESGAGPWGRGKPLAWAALGGVSLGLSLMAVGVFALVAVPVVLLHQAYLRPLPLSSRIERTAARRTSRRWWPVAAAPGLGAAAVALLAAVAVAAPWHLAMVRAHGPGAITALFAPFDAGARDRPLLLGWIIRLAPATLPLGLLAAVRATRRALAVEGDDPVTVGGSFWVLWVAVAALVPAFWPGTPRYLCGLFLLVPLNLLAALGVADLAFRRIPVRTLNWLAPATAAAVAWWASADLSGAVGDLVGGKADTATALGLHLALDLLVIAAWLTRRLERWARRRDDRQRKVMAGFLLAILAVTLLAGGREVGFRHRETDDLLMLRAMILRHDRERPFTRVDVVGPEAFRNPGDGDGPAPGGRLRFILHSALPRLPQHDLANTDELLKVPDREAGASAGAESQRLVILAGRDQSLPNPVKSRLKLEAIHPGRSGVLDAFATAAMVTESRPMTQRIQEP